MLANLEARDRLSSQDVTKWVLAGGYKGASTTQVWNM